MFDPMMRWSGDSTELVLLSNDRLYSMLAHRSFSVRVCDNIGITKLEPKKVHFMNKIKILEACKNFEMANNILLWLSFLIYRHSKLGNNRQVPGSRYYKLHSFSSSKRSELNSMYHNCRYNKHHRQFLPLSGPEK